MRFLLPLFLPFLLILYCSLQPGSSALLYEQLHANESIPAFSLPIVASDSASPGGEENSNNAKPIEDLDKLSDKDLKDKKEQAETKLNNLKDEIEQSKSDLKKKQDDVKGRLQNEFDKKKEESIRLDGIAKGMNKDLKDANDEFNTAEENSIKANNTFNNLEKAKTKLQEAKDKLSTVKGASARTPLAKAELDKWKQDCNPLEGKESKLKQAVTDTNSTFVGAKEEIESRQREVDQCKPNCQSKMDFLEQLKLALPGKETAFKNAQEKLALSYECPVQTAKLEAEVDKLKQINRNPQQAEADANEAVTEWDAQVNDPKYNRAEDNRNEATRVLLEKELAKINAEAVAKTPDEVAAAVQAARDAAWELGQTENEKRRIELEISALETAIGELEKTRKEEETEVAALQTAYARRSTDEKTGMGALPIVGIGIACLVLLAAVVGGGLVYFKFYHNKKGPKVGKGADAKDQLEPLIKANSSSGDNSAVQAVTPIQTPLPEPLPAIAPSAPAAQTAVPALATEKAAMPAPKEEPIEPFATASVEGLHQQLATVPDDVPDQDLKKAIAIVKKDAAPDSFVHYYNDYNAIVYKRNMDYGPGNMKRLQIGTGLTRPPKFNNLTSNDFNKEEAYKFVHKYDGDAAAAAAVNYEDPRTPEVHQYNKDDAMRKLDERKDMRRIAERNKRMGSGRSEREDDTEESTEHIVPGQEYDLIKYFYYEESRFEMLKGYPKLVKGIRRGDEIPPGYITEITKIEEVESEEAEDKKEAAESVESPSHSDKLQTAVRIEESQSGPEKRMRSGSDASNKSSNKKRKNKSKKKNPSRRNGKSNKEDAQKGSNSNKKSSGKKPPSEKSKHQEKPADSGVLPPNNDQPMFTLANGKQIPESDIKFEIVEGEEVLMDDGGECPPIEEHMKGKDVSPEKCAAALQVYIDNCRTNPGVKQSQDQDCEFKIGVIFTFARKMKKLKKLLLMGKGREPTVLSGDTHGNATATSKTLTIHGDPGTEEWMKQRFLFLGDYVDRGPCQEDNIMMLMLAKIAYPDHIDLLRGNHEFYDTNYCYGYYEELMDSYEDEIARDLHFYYNYAFSFMPCAALTTTSRIYHVHGGIPHWVPKEGLEKAFEEILAFVWDSCHGTEKWRALVQACVWNDMAILLLKMFRPSTRGVGIDVSMQQLDIFLKECNVSLVARAHEMVLNGVEWSGDHCITVFSCFLYDHKLNNRSCIVRFSGFGTYTYVFFNPYKASEFNKLTDQQKKQFLDKEAARFGPDHNLNSLTFSIKGNLEALNEVLYERREQERKEERKKKKKEIEKEPASMTLGV